MTNLSWIDLDAAAGWLSTQPDEVMSLIRDGLLGSKRTARRRNCRLGRRRRRLARLWIRNRGQRRNRFASPSKNHPSATRCRGQKSPR